MGWGEDDQRRRPPPLRAPPSTSLDAPERLLATVDCRTDERLASGGGRRLATLWRGYLIAIRNDHGSASPPIHDTNNLPVLPSS